MNLTATAGPLVLHPHGKELPTRQQGPFVTTAEGGILCVDATHAHRSHDEGQTWTSTLLFPGTDQYRVSNERALLRTREGVIISAWMNLKEMSRAPGSKWGGTPEEYEQWVLPTYISRSLDDGKTWEKPILLHKPWCGCIHSLIQTKSGRIVLVGQTIIPEWRHATLMFVSDDLGQTWQASNILDYGVGRHDHAGSCEATVLERADGSLYLLLRTESGYFYEAESTDEGLTWKNLQRSAVPSVTCCGQMARLSDGRAILLWNHPPRSQQKSYGVQGQSSQQRMYGTSSGNSREELSIAFSADDGKTWTDRTVIATRYHKAGDKFYDTWVAYPYLYERKPGELWVTTMQGGLRMKIHTDQITTAEIPVPQSLVFLGDSTTAHRPGAIERVTSDRVEQELLKTGSQLAVLNRGVGGNTSRDGLARLQAEIGQWNAKVVVVQFGINDAAVDVWKSPPAQAPRVSLAEYRDNLKKMVELIRAHEAQPILLTTNPIRWTDKYKELYGKSPYDAEAVDGFERPFLSAYNNAVRELAAERDVPLVDIHAIYLQQAEKQQTSVDSLLLDGVHPNDAGQQINAEQVLPVIQRLLTRK